MVKGEKLTIYCFRSTRLSRGEVVEDKNLKFRSPSSPNLEKWVKCLGEDMIVHSSSSVKPKRDKVIKGKYMVVHSSSCVSPTRSRVIKDKYMIVSSTSSTRSSRGEMVEGAVIIVHSSSCTRLVWGRVFDNSLLT